MKTLTDPDCSLDGQPVLLDRLPLLSSDEIQRMVANHSPDAHRTPARRYHWTFRSVPLEELRCSCDTGEEPDGGWKAAYLRHQASDLAAIKNGSPEYAGRQEWCAEWAKNTARYPLCVVFEDGQYWLWDGHHRLASAFWHEIPSVMAFVGGPQEGRSQD